MIVSTLVTEIVRTGFMTESQRSRLHTLLETGNYTQQETPAVRHLIKTIARGRIEIEFISYLHAKAPHSRISTVPR